MDYCIYKEDGTLFLLSFSTPTPDPDVKESEISCTLNGLLVQF